LTQAHDARQADNPVRVGHHLLDIPGQLVIICDPAVAEPAAQLVRHRRPVDICCRLVRDRAGVGDEAIENAHTCRFDHASCGCCRHCVAAGRVADQDRPPVTQGSANRTEVTPVLLRVIRIQRRAPVTSQIDSNHAAVRAQLPGHQRPNRTVVAGAVDQQHISPTTTEVNPRERPNRGLDPDVYLHSAQTARSDHPHGSATLPTAT
jgi:hypothetical protein